MVRALWCDRLGAERPHITASQELMARIVAAKASWEDRRRALRGLYQETLCFDLAGLALRQRVLDRPEVLLTTLAAPVGYQLRGDVPRGRIEGFRDVVGREGALRLTVESPSPSTASEVEARLFADPLPGMIPFRIGATRPAASTSVISHYLLIDESAS